MSDTTPSANMMKQPAIVVLSLVAWLVLLFLAAIPWLYQAIILEFPFSVLVHVSATIWWLVLLWGLHHLSFQLWGLFKKTTVSLRVSTEKPNIAVLYVTCDDFSPECCESCLEQKNVNHRVFVCDDSKEIENKEKIRAFCIKHPQCILINRPTDHGFKAGNLNHAIRNYVTEDWILIVDADQLLPRAYLSELIKKIPVENTQVAFVQAAHETRDDGNSFFQHALSPEIGLFYFRDLPMRGVYGFVPLLGHGALIRKSIWEELGQFPEIVSEDFAFALRATTHQRRGIYVEEVKSFESYPHDFGGFMVRLKKYAGGTAELLRHELVHFLKGGATSVEKWDFAMQIIWYVFMPFVVLNGFLGAYVLHKLWDIKPLALYPALPYLYSLMLLASQAVNISISQGWNKAWRFYFWSTAVYAAALPLTSLSFIKHLFHDPVFLRTPKNQLETPLGRKDIFVMLLLGGASFVCALVWWSPFSFVLVGYSVAYLSYPLYGKLCSRSLLGSFARLIIYIPGFFMLVAILVMWMYGRY